MLLNLIQRARVTLKRIVNPLLEEEAGERTILYVAFLIIFTTTYLASLFFGSEKFPTTLVGFALLLGLCWLLTEMIIAFRERIYTLTETANALQEESSSWRERVVVTDFSLKQSEKRATQLKADLEDTQQQMANLKRRLEKLSGKYVNLRDQRLKLEAENERLVEQYRKLEKEHESLILLSRLSLLTWLDHLAIVYYRNEVEVEVKFISPLVMFLGYQEDEIKLRHHIRRGNHKEERLEADWVVWDSPRSKSEAPKFIVEAKASDVSLDASVQEQAREYAFYLNAPIYVLTNGRRIKIYRRGVQRDELVLNCRTHRLADEWEKLKRLLGSSFLSNVKANNPQRTTASASSSKSVHKSSRDAEARQALLEFRRIVAWLKEHRLGSALAENVHLVPLNKKQD